MAARCIELLSFAGRGRILHMTWLAFFISFVVWFNHAPLMLLIRQDLGLSENEVNAILILNVALTIPARILIGVLVDRFGPRRTYSALLALSSIPCFMFALAENFHQLAVARLFLSLVGAGFVIGIRMIGDWFPAKQVGIAEGIYAGWGNFGSAAAMLLPGVALMFGDDGWRWAVAITGAVALLYAGVYYASVSDTPEGSTYFKPWKTGAMEVTSIRDLFFCILATLPLYATLSLLVWQLSPSGAGLLSPFAAIGVQIGIWALFLFHAYKIVEINEEGLSHPLEEIHRYRFKQVAILNLAYLITFGSKLAVVSMLPLFFFDTFNETRGVTLVEAGLLASSFTFLNLVARPGGGWLSDKMGRKRSLTLFMLGLTGGYFSMAMIDSDWPLLPAILATLICSVFVQAAEGAVFAMVPLIRRRLTGQIAGMVGAYGNVGSILFLVVLSFVTPQVFFMVIGAAAFFTLFAVQFLDEPKGYMAEIRPDGSIEMIEVE